MGNHVTYVICGGRVPGIYNIYIFYTFIHIYIYSHIYYIYIHIIQNNGNDDKNNV